MATPRLVYDDDCGFCKWCVTLALKLGDFEPVGFDELTPDQKARLPPDWENSAHLLTDEHVYSAGKAVEQTVARFGPNWRRGVRAVSRLPGYRWVREKAYRWGADHRAWWGKLVRRESV
jgi:predicted DCC family thiol-disulfide oxidoreductase YuxK